MRGEATPAEIRKAIHISRQLVYYWAKAAGIKGKTTLARKRYIWAMLVKGAKRSNGNEPEHPDIAMLRHRLAMPRPSRDEALLLKGAPAREHVTASTTKERCEL